MSLQIQQMLSPKLRHGPASIPCAAEHTTFVIARIVVRGVPCCRRDTRVVVFIDQPSARISTLRSLLENLEFLGVAAYTDDERGDHAEDVAAAGRAANPTSCRWWARGTDFQVLVKLQLGISSVAENSGAWEIASSAAGGGDDDDG